MAERSSGQGLGHRSLGVDGRHPRARVSDLPERLPAGSDRRVRSAHRPPVIGNVVASGTAIIDELGAEHMETGFPIVYTSADSVFQIAAHEGIVPVAAAVRWCEVAYDIASKGTGPGPRHRAAVHRRCPARFSARRTATTTPCRRAARRCSIGSTARGHPVTAVGKIEDMFAGRGICARRSTRRATPTAMDQIEALMAHAGSRAHLRQPRRLRHALRPSQRRRRVRGEPRALRRAPRRACCRSCAATICS